jgi:hypothetical protein
MTPNPSSPSHLQPSDAIRRPGASLPWGAWWCGQVVLGMLCATVGAGCGQSSDQGPPGADAGVTTPGTGGAPSGTGGSSVGSGGSPAPGSGSGGVAVAGTGGMPAGTGGAATSASGGVTASATGGVSAAPGGAGGGGAPGGGGNSAGAGGAAPPGADGPACGTAKICDDFESYTTPTNLAPWTTTVQAGSVMADGTHAYSGKQSVLIHANAGANSRAQINRTGSPLFPANPNLFWGRMMVYMTALPASSVHYDNVQGDGQGTGQYRIGGMGGILLNYEPHDCYDHIAPMLPQNKWSCWQWLYDGTKNTIEFYVDGKLQAKVVNTSQGCVDGTSSVWAAPMFNAVHLGWVNYQATTAPVDLWLDDVALGADQIACPTATTYPMAH